ncbi:hypothetical protein [Williamsia sp.]|uniref:DUF6973 domain-containing protein n=1 Tax=Williamsia sp. TaxID=1872085 RepID=UPI001A3086B3|nr:hypothetical protein [Williamsia sp.]MBJ7291625.1 hypothetical protein [Williamsia sp.]
MQYCTIGIVDCAAAQDAASWATGITQARYSSDDAQSFHGGRADSYRHCVWAGATAQRIGEDRAMTVLTVHELDATDGQDHVQMDIENDRTGAGIGDASNQQGVSDTWGWIMSQCAALADSGKLTRLW